MDTVVGVVFGSITGAGASSVSSGASGAKQKTAEPARRILEKVGIDYYNDEVNHVILKTGLHRRLHSKLYYAWVNDRITQAYERGEGNLTLQREMELQVLNEFFPY